ncbi:MAG: CDP-diacylglycerol--serine O-phosphatidyltransferase [Planctomycetes bacterium]|nr:CDP-diacylglycerol--serine O-phosphatidyltransferase [Planctomycetota bacterium]
MIGKDRLDLDAIPEVSDGEPEPRRRMRLIPFLPSLLTLGNLFCGFLAIAYSADAVLLAGSNREAAVDRIALAGLVIFLAMVFDALDGRVARMTGQDSAFGEQLDSLSDMVSFGVAPAIMTKALAEQLLGLADQRVTLGFCVFFVLCAALRLARYNVEHDPGEGGQQSFLGLPSPGAAGMVAAIALFYDRFHAWDHSRTIIAVLPFAVPLLGILMISRIRYPHVMNRFFRGTKPMKYLVFVAFAIVLAVVLRSWEAVLTGLLTLYVLWGPFGFLSRLVTGRAARTEMDIFD